MGGGAVERRPASLAQELPPLTLIDRVEHERRHAVERQQGTHRLIFRVTLGRQGMTARHEHARIGRPKTPRLGQEQSTVT